MIIVNLCVRACVRVRVRVARATGHCPGTFRSRLISRHGKLNPYKFVGQSVYAYYRSK